MFEAEINKLKGKKIEHCANLQWLLQLIKQVIIKTRINVSQGKSTDLRLNWPCFWTNVTKEGWPSLVVRRTLNSPNLSDLLKFSFKYQSLLREMILNQQRNSRPGSRQKRTHIVYSIQWQSWSGWSYQENSWKDRARLACSQTLYFLSIFPLFSLKSPSSAGDKI